MALEAYPINDVLAWEVAADGVHVLVTLGQPDGNRLVLAIPHYTLMELIIALAHATEAFPAPKGMRVSALAMGAKWFEFGQDEASGDFFLRLRLERGGHLAFVMDRSMAELLTETLNAMVRGDAPHPSSQTPLN
jgi:hypothetical protein